MARRSADAALDANEAENALRYRWAERTCRDTLLTGAPARFDQRFQQWQRAIADEDTVLSAWHDRPPSFEAVALDLQGVQVWIRIEDEQAKLNLNELLRSTPEAAVLPEVYLREWAAPILIGRPGLTRPEAIEAFGIQRIESWSQLAPGLSPLELLGVREPQQLVSGSVSEDALATRLTLWGSGSLNLYTASDNVVRTRLQGVAIPTTIENLLSIRRDMPGVGMRGMIDHATSGRTEDRGPLSAVFTDRSQTYSCWIACRPSRPEHAAVQWSLTVSTASDSATQGDGEARVTYFRW